MTTDKDNLVIGRLLESLRSIHESDALSLRQLVSVHRSFLASSVKSDDVDDTKGPNDEHPTAVASTRQEWMNQLCQSSSLSSQEVEECIQIFLGDGLLKSLGDESTRSQKRVELAFVKRQMLCTAQYTLYRLMNMTISSSQAIQGTFSLLLPWVQILIDNSDSSDTSLVVALLLEQDEKSGETSLLQVLLETILGEKMDIPKDDVLLPVLLRWIVDEQTEATRTTGGEMSEAAQLLRWNTRCQTLLHLNNLISSSRNEVEESLWSLLQQGLHQASSLLASPNSMSRDDTAENDASLLSKRVGPLKPAHILQPMLLDVLPILVTSPSKERLIWELLWKELLPPQDQMNTTTNNEMATPSKTRAQWTVGTAVLCAILPKVTRIQLPDPTAAAAAAAAATTTTTTTTTTEGESSDESLARPIQQGCLWKLILTCLESGIHLSKKQTWLKGGGGTESKADTGEDEAAVLNELLRRRGLYLLKVLVEAEKETQEDSQKISPELLASWNRYLACMETMEMETEPHLISQVWDTVQDLAASIVNPKQNYAPAGIPPLSWGWMQILWARVLLSPDNPALRKASLCHLCEGKAGLLLTNASPIAESMGTASGSDNKPKSNETGDTSKDDATKQQRGGKKGRKQNQKQSQQGKKKKGKGGKAKHEVRGMPLYMMTKEFVVHVLLPCFDSLEQAVGTHLHYEEGGKTIKQDLTKLLANMFELYFKGMTDRSEKNKFADFLSEIFRFEALSAIRFKTVTFVLELVASHLKTVTTTHTSEAKAEPLRLPKAFFRQSADALSKLLSLGYVVPAYRDSITASFATILASCEVESVVDVHVVLDVFKLYPLPSLSSSPVEGGSLDDENSWIKNDPSYKSLQTWLAKLEEQGGSTNWGSTVAGTVATAFVDGILSGGVSPQSSAGEKDGSCSQLELSVAHSIVMLCALLQGSVSSEQLWPAINKGLALAPAVALGNWSQSDKVGRALALLDLSCKLQLISGSGNGDLIVDKTSSKMMPPPPSIEQLLGYATDFLLLRTRTSLGVSDGTNKWDGSRNSAAKRITASFLGIIGSLQTINEGFPSSLVVPDILERALEGAMMNNENELAPLEKVSVCFAAVAGGAMPKDRLALCKSLCEMKYATTGGGRGVQWERSLFQCSRWGSLSLLARRMLADSDAGAISAETDKFMDALFKDAKNSVEACPTEGLIFLFDCIATATKSGVAERENKITMRAVVEAMFSTLDSGAPPSDVMKMLNEICSTLFNQEMLLAEAKQVKAKPKAKTPIRNALRRLREMAGTQRFHFLRVALSQICPGWMGSEGQMGVPALLYREDILDLLNYKEELLEISSVKGTSKEYDLAVTTSIPDGTDEQSIVRAFVLCFLDKLPSPGAGLTEEVKTDLMHFLILRLLKDSKSTDLKKMVMLGSPEYVQKIRSWQGLCVLSRFVTSEIAEEVCTEVFQSLREPLHGSIRYFVEVFCIQCSRVFPEIFGKKIAEQIARRDLNLQEISSIMVIAGNLIVGKYREDFLAKKDVIDLHTVLAGASPWLSSTQGFSRGIAQLLVHALIPLAIDTSKAGDGENQDSDWHLRSLYRFLDENQDMKRVRVKQSKFFETYDVDTACTPEYIFTIPVDDGGDANPENMIDVIKKCLVDVYAEAHGDDAPVWKRVQEMLDSEVDEDSREEQGDNDVSYEVNFQRKIIPLETLNLAFEEAQERRLRNIAGRRKQPLILCAALIDKVPNLGGLARTAEIFAASKLVIPDLRVTQMDNFTSLSVGAGDWTEIEECKEENLLEWLLQQRREGANIVGIEQTSSSVPLMQYEFPENKPTVLLLGKEREGIPVEFLDAVDACVEIPQLGIIRSLNVHVSGAISIWEYTRQRIQSNKLDVS